MKTCCGLIIAFFVAFTFASCSTLDESTSNSATGTSAVPGESNPDAPESQPVRTSPGFNF
ncbi:MAG: hypothetical protein JO354_12085 [Verrucomicrobia bacterium]|nr:hypothetical protein [Verrucomicrobiota bacterium]